MTTSAFIQWIYLVASVLFILGLKDLNSARTARRGMFLAEIGMLLAIVGTLLHHEIISYQWIIGGMANACRDNGCALLGGETAEMPGFYP